MSSKLRTTSWILLLLVGGLTLLGSLASAFLAYTHQPYPIGGVDVAQVAAGRPELEIALRAIRGTSAAYGAGFATLFLAIVLGPYRRGEVWSWWAVLAGTLVMALLTIARVPLLGTSGGAGGAALQAGLVVVALLLDAGRLKSR